jgi:hypothetical protein
MGKTSTDNKIATLMAAVSVIGLSVGMMPAKADDLNKQQETAALFIKHDSNQSKVKGSSQIKIDSQQIKYGSQQQKADARQLKIDSVTIKQNSIQQKGHSQNIKLDSKQIKIDSMQQKGTTHSLNPQPLPPG